MKQRTQVLILCAVAAVLALIVWGPTAARRLHLLPSAPPPPAAAPAD